VRYGLFPSFLNLFYLFYLLVHLLRSSSIFFYFYSRLLFEVMAFRGDS